MWKSNGKVMEIRKICLGHGSREISDFFPSLETRGQEEAKTGTFTILLTQLSASQSLEGFLLTLF